MERLGDIVNGIIAATSVVASQIEEVRIINVVREGHSLQPQNILKLQKSILGSLHFHHLLL